MYSNDHTPPHFHAQYGEFEALMSIEGAAIIKGYLPGRALRLVLEWAQLHTIELQDAWRRCRDLEAPERIAPLE